MSAEHMDSCEAAICAAKLCNADIWYHPGSWSSSGILSDSLESSVSGASGSLLSEKRVMLAVNGISKELDNAASLKLPLVVVSENVQINGKFIVFSPSNVQEVFDSILLAYRICEDTKVLLPCVISVGMPMLREPVTLPTEQNIASFLLKLKLPQKIDIKNPYALISSNLESDMENVMPLMKKSADVMKTKFRRSLQAIETYKVEDAEIVFVVSGFDYGTVLSFVDKERLKGEKIGIVRLFCLRPFPDEDVKKALEKAKKIIVLDKEYSSSFGPLFKDIRPFINAVCINAVSKNVDEKYLSEVLVKSKKIDSQVVI